METIYQIAEAYLVCKLQNKEVDKMELTCEKGKLKRMKYTCT